LYLRESNSQINLLAILSSWSSVSSSHHTPSLLLLLCGSGFVLFFVSFSQLRLLLHCSLFNLAARFSHFKRFSPVGHFSPGADFTPGSHFSPGADFSPGGHSSPGADFSPFSHFGRGADFSPFNRSSRFSHSGGVFSGVGAARFGDRLGHI